MSNAGSTNLENSNPFGDGFGPRRVRQKLDIPDSSDTISKSRVHDPDSNLNAVASSISMEDELAEEIHPSDVIQKDKGKERRGVKRPAPELSFDCDGETTMCPPIQPGPLRRSCEIYYQHIGVKRRGSPLWIPEPNNELHISYQRRGMTIGDVGIITDSGSFDFLFNIGLPQGHPINPRQLPDNFVPFSFETADIRESSEFKAKSYLSSASVKKSHHIGDSSYVAFCIFKINQLELIAISILNSSLNFEASASEGAILTMPVGLNSEDLRNIRGIRRYAAINAEHWYKYIIDVRGCEVKNGDVRLVVGYDKTMAWGIATFSNSTAQKTFLHLNFRSVEHSDVGRTYEWEHSGTAEVRAGPDAREIKALRKDDLEEQGAEYENQCLFVRTLNIRLQDDIWKKLESGLGEVEVDGDPGYSTYSDSLLSVQIPLESSSTSQSSASGYTTNQYLNLSTLPTALTGHPSGLVNEMLLKLHPKSRLAITEDQDWISVIKEDDFILPPPDEIYARIIKSFIVREEEDFVFLENMEEPAGQLTPCFTHGEQLQIFRHILNLPTDGAGPFVPQQMYQPSDNGYIEEMSLEGPLYFISEHPQQYGILLEDALHSRTEKLRGRDKVIFEGREPNFSIRLEWPGYKRWGTQMPTKDFSGPPPPIILAKLANHVAECVQWFVQDCKSLPMEEDADQRWRIGDGPNDIKFEDLILVSIHNVSLGSWQPHLRLVLPRNDHAPTMPPIPMTSNASLPTILRSAPLPLPPRFANSMSNLEGHVELETLNIEPTTPTITIEDFDSKMTTIVENFDRTPTTIFTNLSTPTTIFSDLDSSPTTTFGDFDSTPTSLDGPFLKWSLQDLDVSPRSRRSSYGSSQFMGSEYTLDTPPDFLFNDKRVEFKHEGDEILPGFVHNPEFLTLDSEYMGWNADSSANALPTPYIMSADAPGIQVVHEESEEEKARKRRLS